MNDIQGFQIITFIFKPPEKINLTNRQCLYLKSVKKRFKKKNNKILQRQQIQHRDFIINKKNNNSVYKTCL